jgi:AraC-like DNA-binding protein
MVPIRRPWLFATARQFQIVALDPRLQPNGAETLIREVLALVPTPGTELEQRVLDGLIWRLHGTAERRRPPCHRALSVDSLELKVKEYLDANYRKRVTYTDVAKRFGRNPQYIQTQFKACFHLSIRNYLTALRIDAVSAQIRDGEKVESAALSVGWTKRTFFRARQRLQLKQRRG